MLTHCLQDSSEKVPVNTDGKICKKYNNNNNNWIPSDSTTKQRHKD